MRFEETLKTLVDFFEREDIRYAVIGDLALSAYGLRHVRPRIEFAVAALARERVIEHVNTLGYRTAFASPRCTVHVHEDAPFGKIAFIYTALTPTSRSLFDALGTPPSRRLVRRRPAAAGTRSRMRAPCLSTSFVN